MTTTKKPREWSAPDGRMWKFQGDMWWYKVNDRTWRAVMVTEYADLAPEYRDKLAALRADPYEPIHERYDIGGTVFVYDGTIWRWSDTSPITSAVVVGLLNHIRDTEHKRVG